MPTPFDDYLLQAHDNSIDESNSLDVRLTAIFLKGIGDAIQRATEKYEAFAQAEIAAKRHDSEATLRVIADIASAAARIGVFFTASAIPGPVQCYLHANGVLDGVLDIVGKTQNELLHGAVAHLVQERLKRRDK